MPGHISESLASDIEALCVHLPAFDLIIGCFNSIGFTDSEQPQIERPLAERGGTAASTREEMIAA